ncbi:hypothetical protein ACFL3J_00880 [Candidatus Omnitrophota bacterium]
MKKLLIVLLVLMCITLFLGIKLNVINKSEPTVEALLKVPEEIEIGGKKYYLEAYLWRDFMPISPPDGKPLMGVVKLLMDDLSGLPDGIDVTRVWIIDKDKVWQPDLSDKENVKKMRANSYLQINFRNGPKWGPNIYVDVVLNVVDSSKGSYLLRGAYQYIERTD